MNSQVFDALPESDLIDLRDILRQKVSEGSLPPAKIVVDKKGDLFIGTGHQGAWIGKGGSHVRAIKKACSTRNVRVIICELTKVEEIIDLKKNYVSVQGVFIRRLGVTYQYNYNFLNPEGVNIDRCYVYLAKGLRLKDQFLRELHFDLDYSLFIHRDDVDEFINRYKVLDFLKLKKGVYSLRMVKEDYAFIEADPLAYFEVTEESLQEYGLTKEKLLSGIDYFYHLEERYWKANQ